MTDENAALLDENTTLRKEVSQLKVKIAEERDKYKSLWRESCEQLREHDELIAKKDAEIGASKSRLAELETLNP